MLVRQCVFLLCFLYTSLANVCLDCNQQRMRRNTRGSSFPIRITPKQPADQPSENEVPLTVIKDLDNVQSIDDLIDNFIVNKEDAREPPEPPRTLPALEYEPPIPVQASCEPRNTTIPTIDVVEPGVVHWPSCMVMSRCGGCCGSDLLQCQPDLVTNEHYKVVRMVYEHGGLQYDSTKIVQLQRHVTCSCQCIVKPEDCAPSQIYVESKCRCECNNTKDEEECYADSEKIWEYSSCSCKCRNEKPCSSGLYFSHATCSCKKYLAAKTVNSITMMASSAGLLDISVLLLLVTQGANL